MALLRASLSALRSGVKSALIAPLGALLLAGCGGSEPSASAPFTAEDLAGQWASPSCENGGSFFYTRAFILTEATWAITFRVFGDEACTFALATVDIDGGYTLGEVDGDSREADFARGRVRATAHVADMATAFTGAACGAEAWEVDVIQDISSTGCAPLGAEPVSTCPTEHDRVRLEDDALFFGDRSGGMCDAEKRTTTLQTTPVVRQG